MRKNRKQKIQYRENEIVATNSHSQQSSTTKSTAELK